MPAERTWDLLEHQHQLGGLDHPGRGNSIAIGLEEAGLAPNMPHREPLLHVKSIEDSNIVHMRREHRRFDTRVPSLLVSMPLLVKQVINLQPRSIHYVNVSDSSSRVAVGPAAAEPLSSHPPSETAAPRVRRQHSG